MSDTSTNILDLIGGCDNYEFYCKLLKNFNSKNYKSISLSLVMNKYNIEKENMLFFLANCLNETGNFTKFKESLYYTTEERLKQVFPLAFDKTRFPNSLYNASEYIKQPEKLANLIYSDINFKKGLGNVNQGDGWKYIGRGAIQITGRNNYSLISKITCIDYINHPELLEIDGNAVSASLAWWVHNNIHLKKTLLETRQVVAGNYSKNPFGIKEVTEKYNLLKKYENEIV